LGLFVMTAMSAYAVNAQGQKDLLISDIQGAGSTSPLVGQKVKITAVVTGDFQNTDADKTSDLGGFYVQQEVTDADSATSDGIFIYDKKFAADVEVGDRVEISGTVKEYFGETQIAASTVNVIGKGTIKATNINLPTTKVTTNSKGKNIADLEQYEGMLVRFPQKLSVSSLYHLGRFGEVGLAQGGQPFQYTNSHLPDISGYKVHMEMLAARSIILDDGLTSSNPSKIRYLKNGTNSNYSIRSGDSITAVTGNLRYSRGSGGSGSEGWRLEPTEIVTFHDDNPRPQLPKMSGNLTVASYNVLNLFSTVDNGKPICGSKRKQRCRGADSAVELSRQLKKTVTAIKMMDADIIGLMELENNDTASIALLVDALNDRIGSRVYAYVNTGSVHTDVIKTGFIYKIASVRTKGIYKLLTTAIDPRFIDSRNRPALAQTFQSISTDAAFTVIVNHLKSKGSACDKDGDPDILDGQGNCNIMRTEAVKAIADWIGTDPTASDDPDYLIIGDFNAYAMEDPLRTFSAAGFTHIAPKDTKHYSFAYNGQVGAYDYAFASSSMAIQVKQVFEWHINSDEPTVVDYNLDYGRDADIFNPDLPYRASDHDPVLIGLELTK